MQAITWVSRGMGIVGSAAMQCNNPGAIPHSKKSWRGQRDEQHDPHLVEFKSAFWGFVALARILGKVERKIGPWTVARLLSGVYWKDTSECIEYVRLANSWSHASLHRLRDEDTLLRVVASVCRFQCGMAKRGDRLPYGVRTMQAALREAWPQWFEVKIRVEGVA